VAVLYSKSMGGWVAVLYSILNTTLNTLQVFCTCISNTLWSRYFEKCFKILLKVFSTLQKNQNTFKILF